MRLADDDRRTSVRIELSTEGFLGIGPGLRWPDGRPTLVRQANSQNCDGHIEPALKNGCGGSRLISLLWWARLFQLRKDGASVMPIPNAETAFIPKEKLSSYLLNSAHPVGGPKARWFISLGYDPSDPDRLEADLLEVVRDSSDYVDEATKFGEIHRGWPA